MMEAVDMNYEKCDGCGESLPGFDTVKYGSIEDGYRNWCSRCFNAEMATRNGLDDFENVRLEPISLTDSTGDPHQFHFQIRLLGTFLSLKAFELRDQQPCGHQFEILGDPECDAFALLGKLIERMRRALASKQLKLEPYGRHIVGDSVVGRLEWDDAEDGEVPLVVIDGEEMSWADFGRMLMTFEGFQFKMKIGELSEEL